MTSHHAQAVVLEEPARILLRTVELQPLGKRDVRVKTRFSGVSTGTERLFYTGEMPHFPGMGYPLVPGYETVGEVIEAGPEALFLPGEIVFVPGANCYDGVRGLFGGAASTLVSASDRLISVPAGIHQEGVLFALAATAHHALAGCQRQDGSLRIPDLIVGHGVMGRLLARLVVALGGMPIVWEPLAERQVGAQGYLVMTPEACRGKQFGCIVDASGAGDSLGQWIDHLSPGGEVVLAGFYTRALSFNFVPAFLREARLRVAAQWQPSDLQAVAGMVRDGSLSLDGLITDEFSPAQATQAYEKAFEDPNALKVVLNWGSLQ